MLAQILFTQKDVEETPVNFTPKFTPSKKTRVLPKGVKRSVKFTPTRDAILQFYAQIHQESLRKAATHFGVSHTTIKNVLNEN